MAELIKTTDSLNDGRKKLNDAITDSNAALSTANTAKQTANLAKAESESTQTQLDTIVIEGDSSVEAAQARVNNSGTAFPTLKQRLDAEHQEVTAQLQQTEQNLSSQLAQTAEDNKRRIDNLVIPIAPENVNVEVTDAHISTAKSTSFPTIGHRFEDVESEVVLDMKSKLRNGDFNEGLDHWTKSIGTVTGAVSNNTLEITATGNLGYQQNVSLIKDHIYYMSAKYRKTTGTGGFVRLFNPTTVVVLKDLPDATVAWTRYSATIKAPDNMDVGYYLRVSNATVGFRENTFLDLTEIFGVGVEPSKEEMDAIIEKIPSAAFDGNIKVNALSQVSYQLAREAKIKIGEVSTPLTPEQIFTSYLQSGGRIKLLGDSITHGIGGTGFAEDGMAMPNTEHKTNPNGFCWANSLRDLLSMKGVGTVVNWGVRGEGSQFFRDNISAYVEPVDNLIILMIGTNDRHLTTNTTKLYNNLLAIIDYVRGQGKGIILMSANAVTSGNENDPVYNFGMFEVNLTIQRAAYARGMGYISNYKSFLEYEERAGNNIGSLLGDGLHPNDDGHRLMYRYITKSLGIGYLQDGVI